MERKKLLTHYLIVIMFVLLAFMMMEFMALADIHHEYVSKNMVTNIAPETLSKYPSFSNNTGEWNVIGISFISSLALIITSLILSIILYRRLRLEAVDI